MKDILDRLNGVPRAPIPLHSWMMTPELVNSTAFHRRVVEVTRSTSFNLQYASEAWVRKHMATKPEWLAVHLSPFVHAWKPEGAKEKHVWKRDDWQYESGAPLVQYIWWFYGKCQWLKGIIGDQNLIFIFDHELWPVNKRATMWLNVIVAISRRVFPTAEIAWYNHGQVAVNAGPPISEDVLSDFAGCSLYYPADSHENHERLVNTQKKAIASGKRFMPWVSLYHYEDRSYVATWPKRSADTIIPNHAGAVWQLGRDLATKADAICFWPPLFRGNKPLMPELFLEFCMGMAGMRHDHAEGSRGERLTYEARKLS